MTVSIHADVAPTFSLAAQQNAYPLLKRVLITHPGGVDESIARKVTDIRFRLTCEPQFLEAEEWLIDRLESGQSVKLQDRPLKPHYDKLSGLTEEVLVQLIFAVSYVDVDGQTHELFESHQVSFLPADYWGGESRQAELLAAFVQPNVHTVELITSRVAHSLRNTGQNSAIDGYQSNTRERPFLFGSALWSTLFNERLMYLSPPNGWAKLGQRIRTATDILEHKTAACLDTSVLFASCLENMGLNPVIALTKTHAFAGFWLIEECFPILTNDDPIDLRKRIDTSDIVMFETTLVTNDTPVTFKQAIERAKTLLDEDRESEFIMLIDIKQARARRVKPLGVVEGKSTFDVEPTDDGQSSMTLGIDAPPPLPPVRGDERLIEDTPDTRVDMWQRKLLDLTKRNPLLNVKSSALKLFCPDLPTLEDMLAGDEVFSFISAEETPLVDSERSVEAFRLSTGEDLHREFALQQLNNKKLIINDTVKRKDAKLVELLRKAKNDLEEGGSNTLFLAVGLLRWREIPDSDKSFRAPLIMLPVKLERRSAQAPVKLRQLPDEEAIFNLTLIEMLQTDYDINLDSLRHGLPEDESGVDVEGIWNIVRAAIKEQPGFIVVEEIVLGSFSFAKYLMWKDLKDRTELLKQSPFVKHLVDHPSEAYQQESCFIECDQVDKKIKPEYFYAPLNCDSSQMVAVEASSRPQDFVLEGPPGTGKSETIANIISHNLALGRKVLFVAEKMAALQVVYRRMEKIGLGHLCLELHSNKANKKSVLDQLGAAWSHRESETQSDWISKAQKLDEVREGLNKYVAELHCRHALGLSARDAMARVVRFQHKHPLRLSWSSDLSQAPVQSETDLGPYLETARELGIAFGEIEDLDPDSFASITQVEYSNQWQTNINLLATRIVSATKRACSSAEVLLSTIGLNVDHISARTVYQLSSLKTLCDLAMTGEVDFALQGGGPGRVQALRESVALHSQLHEQVASFGRNLKWPMLEECDWEQWITWRNEATGLFGFIKRYSLRKTIKKAGLDKIDDLSVLELGVEARETLKKLKSVASDIESTSAWLGVDPDADANKLAQKLDKGEKAIALLKRLVGVFSDPADALSVLRKQLVDGRDLLSENSKILNTARRLDEDYQALEALMSDAEELNVSVSTDHELVKVSADFQAIGEQGQRLNRWCRWLAMKRSATHYELESLSAALESRAISPKDCENNAMTALCVWLAPKLIDRSPTLVQFTGASHESTIERFRELDAEVSETTAEYIFAKTAGNVPDRNASNAPPEYGVLARELTKKSRHKPVRALVSEMGSSLTDLVPCFMMSPLSVAQFLPADFALFDLVVFDEASQITTWDAVGAIARGKNVIVVGDPKQMPPSNTFGRKEEEDSDEDDLESILDQALAARLPHLRLTGHYRSRHETLIAFSNSHYYENKLTTFPSAETKQSAVTLHRVKGVYSKGRGQTNSIEAQAVIKEVVRRLERMLNGEELTKSIGIVTINSQQQRMVEDFLDEARRKNPNLEPFFTATDTFDPVFVKNLESVQGDERDIIVLSLTYGPTEPEGRTMSMQFGPLNKQGGERRLNVAVTRATTEVLVFSSFDSSMVDLSRTKATAVEHLKNYLEFAERGPIALAEFSTANYGVDQFDSDFELAVAMDLREKGWKVQTQIGVSKFRVDLGIVHPDKPGEYLTGIECDGATYHSSPSARDRDRVRQVILENLGWRILRLWSTDYFQDPEYAMKKLHGNLESFLEADREQNSMPATEINSEIDAPATVTDTSVSKPKAGAHSEKAESLVVGGKDTHESHEPALAIAGDLKKDSDQFEDLLADLPTYDKDRYFLADHRTNLSRLAKSILEIKNGITLHELTLDVAQKHGLNRSSRKQRQHLRDAIKSWAGFWRKGEERTTVWLSPDDVCDEITWRGLFAFGVERDWKELCYQEQIGIARAATTAQPSDPIDWLFREFTIARRHSSTAEIFQEWVDRLQPDGQDF